MSEPEPLPLSERMGRVLFYVIMVGVAVAIIGVGIPLILMTWNLRQNGVAKDALMPAIRDRYPALDVGVGGSYERPVVYVMVRGVSDPATMEEIRAFIERVKQERGITRRVELTFWDDENNEVCKFEV